MGEQFVVPNTETWMEGDLHVALAMPVHARGPVPLLVLLDGQSTFLTAVEHARTVSLVTLGALPPIAIVGVWRQSADPLDYFSTRFRDFTPYEWVLPGPFADDNAMVRLGTGGAAGLLHELVDAVLPAVSERVEVSGISIGGWSLSGLFAAWAWRERPDVFAHLVAVSPSLWWGDGRLLDEGVPSRPGAKAFVSAGQREEGDMSLVWPQIFANAAQREAAGMVRNAVRFGSMCAAAGVDAETVVFDDEHHVTLVPASLARGIQHLYANP
ncbi:MAG: alpha/beta hydrolase-fold protein [Ilumatobacteraceae bacterium]